MAVATFVDRADCHDEPGPKWAVMFIGLAALMYFTKHLWTFDSLMEFLLSKEFWIPFAKYLGLGVAYAIVEFVFAIRTSKRQLKDAWSRHLAEELNYQPRRDLKGFNGTVLSLYKTESLDFTEDNAHIEYWAKRRREDFVSSTNSKLLAVRVIVDSKQVIPTINKSYVYNNLFVWIIFWPFYAVSLILGRFLTDVLTGLSKVFVRIGDQIVKIAFKDMFRL